MASAMYATCQDYHHVRGNSIKGSSSRSKFLVNSINLFNAETVGESDTRSQRTAEVCHEALHPLSETASEDSCSIRRNLTANRSCDAHMEASNSATVFLSSDASLMTRAERNQVRKQLKDELDKVHSMIALLEARESDLKHFMRMPELETNLSSSKSAYETTHTQQDFPQFGLVEERPGGWKRPKTKGVKRALHLNADLQVLKRPKFETDAKKLADLYRQCGTILKKLRTHKFSWVFNQPVDFVALQIPDYPIIIKHQMDLGTIKTKMDLHHYHTPFEFAADVRLTFANAMKFNPKGHDVHYMADFLLKIFEERWKTLDKKLKQLNLYPDSGVRDYSEAVETVVQNSYRLSSSGPFDAATAARGIYRWNQEGEKRTARPMTFEEKQLLSQMLEEVPVEKLDQVMAIIERKDPGVQPVDGELTVEIDCLDAESSWELYDLLKHPFRASKSIIQGSKQAIMAEVDGKDEEIDIGVDAPTSYAPVDIDKDVSPCSSRSSSSSSESSSGSDSDSSGSDSDEDDAQSRGSEAKPSPAKEPVGSGGAICEPRGSPTPKMDDGKRPLSDLDEEVSITRPSAADAEQGQRDEACLPQPLQQEKLHRAALLKSRFADTILKAREKTLPAEKRSCTDPEKLKREREELEAERARLQAEAKAAEIARQKVEAELREQARRAARLRLQQMEKTVELDEGGDFLKDLEMTEGPMVFPFIGRSNPLEQLGLFMKDDHDEEDEHDGGGGSGPSSCPGSCTDVSPSNQNGDGEMDDLTCE